jgi:protein-serine/threonine kinase
MQGGTSPISPALQQHLNPEPSSSAPKSPRPDDYVYFERSTSGFTSDAIARSTAAKLKLESYYKMAVDSAIERNARCVFDAFSFS